MHFHKLLFIFTLLFSQLIFSQETINEGQSAVLNNPNNNVGPDQSERLRAISIVNDVEENKKFISKLNSVDSMLILPKGISKKIGAVRYTIAIDSMKFKPNGAYLSAYAAVKFPGTTNPIAFGGKNLKFNPEGVIGGEQAKLMLLTDHTITINPNVKMVLLGAENANWVSWNCGGFDRIHLKGKFIFDTTKVTPDKSKTSDNDVKATFEFEGSNLHEFICQVSITPFKIKGLNDLSFEVINATVDYSELANAPNMIFPPGYSNQNLQPNLGSESNEESLELVGGNNIPNSGSPINTQLWTGFYLQSLKVTLPTQLNKGTETTTLSVNNMLIDNMGFTGRIQANSVFSTSEGSMSGWGFSLDEIGLNFVCNNLVGGNLIGKVAIPVDENNSLNYSAYVSKNQNSTNLNYLFAISPTNNLEFDVFGATINVKNNSSIIVSNVNNKFKPIAILNGDIGFNNTKLNSGIGKLTFQNLTIVTDAPYITSGLFGLTLTNAAQLKYRNFSLSLNNFLLGVSNGKPRISADVGINLTEQGTFDISVATNVTVVGKLVPTTNPKFANLGKLVLDNISINGVYIDVQTTPFTLTGNINFMDNHPVYGDGFFGSLYVDIAGLIQTPGVSVGFGRLPTYKYFFIDVMVPGPIPIPNTPIVITSIIGGISYHLQPNKTSESEFLAMTNSYATNYSMSNPMNYTPNENVGLGLKMGVNLMIIEGSVKGSAILQIAFNNNGGINTINLKGNVQAMATGIPINGNMEINYNFPSHTFDGLFGISATYYGLINGNGLLKIHSDPNNWHVCFGRPSQPFNANMFFLANVNGYLMTGNNLENVSFANVPSGNRQPTLLSNGNAICMGAWVNAGLNANPFGCEFFTVTPNFNFQIGVDGMIKDYGNNATCTNDGEPFGINGKYLQASAYLEMSGGLYISGNFKFPGDCPSSYQTHPCGPGHCCCITINVPCIVNSGFNFNILNTPNISANLTVKMPKPLYFAGNLSANYDIFGRSAGSVSFNYKYGNNCITPY
jgi:hypothetical protein